MRSVNSRPHTPAGVEVTLFHDLDSLSERQVRLGYTDQSHFTRDFRTATGITPDAYRPASDQLPT